MRRNFFALTVGRLLASAAQWMSLVVIAKSSDVKTVGVFALAQVICIPIAEVARMGLREVKATDIHREYPFGSYLGLRIATAGAGLIAMAATGAVAANSATVFLVIFVYALSRVVELLSDIVYGLFQVQGRLDLIGRSLAIVAPLSLVMLSVGFLLTESLVVAVAGQLVAYVLVFVFNDLAVARRLIGSEPAPSLRPAWRWSTLVPLFRRTIPLGVASLLAMVALALPRLIVVAKLGTSALGIFAPLFVLAMAPSRIVHALGTTTTTPLASLHSRGDRVGFVRLLAKLAAGTVGMGLVGVLIAVMAGDWVLRVIYTSDYVAHADVFTILVVAGAIRFAAELLQYALVATRRFWWLTMQFGAAAAVALIAGLVLVPRGLVEAGVAVTMVFTAQLAVAGFALRRNLPSSYPGSQRS